MKRGKIFGKKSYEIKVNPELDKYLHMGLFQDKIDMAVEIINKYGLPKELYRDRKEESSQ